MTDSAIGYFRTHTIDGVIRGFTVRVQSLLSVVGLQFNQVILSLQLSVNRQGLLADKKCEGKCFGVFFFSESLVQREFAKG